MSSSHSKPSAETPHNTSFRNYDAAADHVTNFYREHHQKQTHEFATQKKREYAHLNKGKATAWDMMEKLDLIHDNSDPDIHLSQKEHAFQVAQAMRREGLPDWMILAGFVHDLGKALIFWGEPQWAVVGDTFPTGLQYSKTIVHYKFLEENPDINISEYNTDYGIYEPGIGLDNVNMTWGHDEYLYQVLAQQSSLPEEALFAIRYHSCYPLHSGEEHRYLNLMNPNDKANMKWVKMLNSNDLYSKTDDASDNSEHISYYRDLIEKYIPGTLNW